MIEARLPKGILKCFWTTPEKEKWLTAYLGSGHIGQRFRFSSSFLVQPLPIVRHALTSTSMRTIHNYARDTCRNPFPQGLRAREVQLRSTGHHVSAFEFDGSSFSSFSESARFKSMQQVSHFATQCSLCPKTWSTDEQRIRHEYEDHSHCSACEKTFISQNNLKMHLHSRIHRNSKIQCLFCKACYETATGLIYHIERGSCPMSPHLNRDTLYKVLRDRDPEHSVTINLTEWTGSTQYEASSSSYNADREGWECSICLKLFKKPQSLRQHLGSPIHQVNLYHCPSPPCKKQFTTLAGFIHHLESEACGYTRFDGVQRIIKDVLGGSKTIKFD
ncbi:hypothetical protein GGS21DRAFT_545932 [Xylaria nigripes]|nr:hypothetical protein GGS21DRAFT_545932 [Xylaria nigripes]